MPASNTTDRATDNKPLEDFRKLKSRYGGPLSEQQLNLVKSAINDLVPNGRYTSRTGSSPVCVLARDYDKLGDGFAHVMIVYTPVNKKGDLRMGIEQFLSDYKFFETDCA